MNTDCTRPWRLPVAMRNLGTSLTEVVVTVAVASIGIGSAVLVMLHSEVLFAEQMTDARVEQAGRLIVDKLSDTLRSASADSILPSVVEGSSWISYQPVVGSDSSGPVLGSRVTIDLRKMSSEELDGIDNNGNGIVDEMNVTSSVDGVYTPLVGHVSGLSITYDGNKRIDFSVSIDSFRRSSNRVETSVFSGTLCLRN